nr:AAA family ATPase [Gemmatimonadota bacterium]
FQVIDIKASPAATIAHHAQVAFYTLLLEQICREEGIQGGTPELRFGRVWARNGKGPQRFALGAYRHHVRHFLREVLPHAATRSPAACGWHLSGACAGCSYFHHCREEADRTGDLSRVVGITSLAKEVLHERRIRSVEALAGSFRRDTYTGCHSLEANAERLQKRARATQHGKLVELETRTHLLAPHEDVRVIVTAEGDPVTGLCFALGLRSWPPRREEVFLAAAGTPQAEREMLRAFLARVDALFTEVDTLFTEVDAHNRTTEKGGRTLHLYLWDRTEIELLRGLLERHLQDLEVQPAIGRLLRLAAPRGALLDPEVLRSSLGTVLADAVGALFALPIPYSYDLASVSERLQPEEAPWVHRPRADYGWPLSSQVAFERIHNLWRRWPHRTRQSKQSPEEVEAEIRRTILSKLAAVDSVLRAVRERTRAARARRGEPLQLEKKPFTLAEEEDSLGDPTLEMLRIFARLESTAAALALRELHLLPSAERARRGECIPGLSLVERREDGTLLLEFDPEWRDAKFRPGDFNLLLTNDDGRSLVELLGRGWDRRSLQVSLVDYDLAADPPRVFLAPGEGFAKAEAKGRIDLDLHQCALDRAPSDFNTPRILATLQAIAAGKGEAAFVRGLIEGQVPEEWTPPYAEAEDAVLRGISAHATLNPDQETAWRAAFERCLTVVWGPPGTGKTYLLGWMLIGLAEAARRAGRPCRILVTAATHRAVVNVLSRIARELARAGIPSPLRLVKLRGSGNDADRDLDGLAVELLEDERLPGLLAAAEGGEPVVIGSTVWSLWKQMRSASRAGALPDPAEADTPVQPWFDVVVIDEASQIKLSEALIALSSIRAGGQVILCGDDRQLAPVVQGRYPREAGTLFGSAFGHFAARFERLTLHESRRMNRALIEYPREIYYPGLVSMCPEQRIHLGEPRDFQTDPADALLRELFLAPEDAVVFCTYSGIRAAARNPFEARLAARLVRLARELLRDPDTGKPYPSERFISEALAVISPHRAQNSAILAELLQAGFRREELPVVDTVERMQGNEREMIIVSYGVADREYAEAEAEFLLNPNRFNVSITRPRSKLILLMSEEILRAVPRDEEVLTASMAIQGYRDHCRDGVREVELPGPAGEAVRVRCHYRRLRG